MCPLALLTGFSYGKMYGRFPRTKKIGHDTYTFVPALSLVDPCGIVNDVKSHKAELRLADKEFLSNGNRARSVLSVGLLPCSQY